MEGSFFSFTFGVRGILETSGLYCSTPGLSAYLICSLCGTEDVTAAGEAVWVFCNTLKGVGYSEKKHSIG